MKQFIIIMLDICDMMENDKLFYFIDSLSQDATMELQRRRVQKLANMVTTAECLVDYDVRFPISMRSQCSTSHSGSGSGGQSGGSNKSKSRGGNNGLAL